MFNKKKPDLSKDEKYVEDKQVYISLHDSEVEISNHSFLYRKTFRLSFVEDLQKKVRDVVKVEREQLKKGLFKNELELLQKIKENIRI